MHRAAAVAAREPPLDLGDLLVAPPAASFRKFRARSPGLHLNRASHRNRAQQDFGGGADDRVTFYLARMAWDAVSAFANTGYAVAYV